MRKRKCWCLSGRLARKRQLLRRMIDSQGSPDRTDSRRFLTLKLLSLWIVPSRQFRSTTFTFISIFASFLSGFLCNYLACRCLNEPFTVHVVRISPTSTWRCDWSRRTCKLQWFISSAWIRAAAATAVVKRPAKRKATSVDREVRLKNDQYGWTGRCSSWRDRTAHWSKDCRTFCRAVVQIDVVITGVTIHFQLHLVNAYRYRLQQHRQSLQAQL